MFFLLFVSSFERLEELCDSNAAPVDLIERYYPCSVLAILFFYYYYYFLVQDTFHSVLGTQRSQIYTWKNNTRAASSIEIPQCVFRNTGFKSILIIQACPGDQNKR